MKWALIFLFFCQPGNSKNLSFYDALTIALENSTSFRIALAKKEQGHLKKRNSVSRFFPQLDLSLTTGVSNQNPKSLSQTNVPWTSQGQIVLSQSIYDNGENYTNYKIADLLSDVSELELDQSKNQLAYDLIVAFSNYLVTKKNLEIQTNQLEKIRKEYQVAQVLYKQGMKTRKDFLRFQGDAQRAEVDLKASQAQVRVALNELATVMGLESVREYELQGGIEDFVKLQAPLMAGDIKKNPRLLALEKQVQVAERNSDLESRKFLPQISLDAAAFQSHNDFVGTGNSLDSTKTTGASALITLKFNLLDWGIRRRNTEISEQNKIISENTYKESQFKTFTEVDALKANIDYYQSSEKLLRDLLKLETENNDIISKEYREGKATYFDLIQSLTVLLSAQKSYLDNSSKLKQNIARFYLMEGSLYEQITKK